MRQIKPARQHTESERTEKRNTKHKTMRKLFGGTTNVCTVCRPGRSLACGT